MNAEALRDYDAVKLLAFDTSAQACSVALLAEGRISSRFQIVPKRHHELLLPMLDELLCERHMGLSDLHAVACSHGPGSFTGLRIAVGAAQGLSLAYGLPVITVSSLRAMAQSCYRRFDHARVLAALDAQISQLYVGYYIINNQYLMEEISCDELIKGEAFCLPKSERWIMAGAAWNSLNLYTAGQIDMSRVDGVIDDCLPMAEDIVHLAAKKFLLEDYANDDTTALNYLYADTHWR